MREFITGNITCSGERYTYHSDAKTVECTLECKLNLAEFEKQYFVFTENFIKNRLSKYLPVVYSVYSPDFANGVDVCRARYLLHPFDGTALVLYIDKDYYEKQGDYEMPDRRETVKKRKIVKARGESCEYGKYDYTDTIRVSAKAVCHEGDTYIQKTGEAVSLSKAMIKMYSRVAGVYGEIRELMDVAFEDMTASLYRHYSIACKCQDILNGYTCDGETEEE